MPTAQRSSCAAVYNPTRASARYALLLIIHMLLAVQRSSTSTTATARLVPPRPVPSAHRALVSLSESNMQRMNSLGVRCAARSGSSANLTAYRWAGVRAVVRS